MFEKILEKIKPSNEETEKIKKLANDIIKKIKIKDAKTILGGSLEKGTWLIGMHDIDLFVKFNYKKFKSKSDKISDILEKNIRKFKAIRLHGSRDYFQIKKGKFTIEIVPILDIKKASRAVNITDISPLHAGWVKKHRLQDEIRLAKAFATAQHVYGAETHIRGFSGYVLEILTIYYGSFMNFIKNVAKWKKQTIIDPEKKLKNPLKELNKSKIQSPLILIDPVDKGRNAAAVLSVENYNKLISAANSFLKNSSEKYFLVKEEKIPNNAILIIIKPRRGKMDIIGGKLYSLFNKIKTQLELEDFNIRKSGFNFNDGAIFWFVFKVNKLSKYEQINGPPLSLKKHVERFKARHKRIKIRNNFIYAIEERKFTYAKKFITYLINCYKKDLDKVGRVVKIA